MDGSQGLDAYLAPGDPSPGTLQTCLGGTHSLGSMGPCPLPPDPVSSQGRAQTSKGVCPASWVPPGPLGPHYLVPFSFLSCYPDSNRKFKVSPVWGSTEKHISSVSPATPRVGGVQAGRCSPPLPAQATAPPRGPAFPGLWGLATSLPAPPGRLHPSSCCSRSRTHVVLTRWPDSCGGEGNKPAALIDQCGKSNTSVLPCPLHSLAQWLQDPRLDPSDLGHLPGRVGHSVPHHPQQPWSRISRHLCPCLPH